MEFFGSFLGYVEAGGWSFGVLILLTLDEEDEKMKLDGQLEIDRTRGVIYFHLTQEEDIEKYGLVTVLRICNLPRIPKKLRSLDVVHMHGCDWEEK